MRIVVDLQSCQNGSRYRGIGRYALAITKAMIALNRGHDFRLFLSDRYPETIPEIRRQFDGILPQDSIAVCSFFKDINSAPPANAWRTRAAEVIRTEFLSRLEPDIVFVPSLFEGFWDNVVVSVDQTPFPTAVTLHDLIPLEDPERYMPEQRDRDAYFRKLRDARRADLLICISSHVANEATQLLGADPARIVTALNGVDSLFQPPTGTVDRAALMDRLGISRPFIFNTSPLEYRKNLEGLIAGFASMSRDMQKAHQLVIAGRMDSYARTYLAGLARDEGLPADTIVLPGHVSDSDLIALYSECALFAFPSHSEGFGLPPLEAMACGAPVMASSATSLPEVMGRSDLLADPKDAVAIGAIMERIISNPAIQAELRAYGPQRAREFPWQRTAEIILDAFEKLHRGRKCSSLPSNPGRPRVALACETIDRNGPIAGRLAGLIQELSNRCDVVLFCGGSGAAEDWALAHVETQNLEQLYRRAGYFDTIIYATDPLPGTALTEMMDRLPGVLLLLQEVDPIGPTAPLGRDMPWSIQAGLYAEGGLAALDDAIIGSIAAHLRSGRTMPAMYATLREADGDLPLLPLFGSERAGMALRDDLGIATGAPLVVAIAGSEEAGTELVKRFRQSVQGATANLVWFTTSNSAMDDDSNGITHLVGRVRRLRAHIRGQYRGLLSAADLLLLSSDIPTHLRDRLTADARALKLEAIFDADRDSNVNEQIVDILSSLKDAETDRRHPAAPGTDPVITVWVDRILEAIAAVRTRRPLLANAVAVALPGSVRGESPNAYDIASVATALAANSAIEREPACFVDLTAFHSRENSRGIDPAVRVQLRALLRRGGKRVLPIVHEGGHFTIAYRLAGSLLGLRSFFRADETLAVRPGDRIVGLDIFQSFAPGSLRALCDAQARGAALLYLADGQMALDGQREDQLTALLFAWMEETAVGTRRALSTLAAASAGELPDPHLLTLIKGAAETDLPIEILKLTDIGRAELNLAACQAFELPEPSIAVQQAWAQMVTAANGQPAHIADQAAGFAVMGHLLGSYSLAIINRSVARTLEEWRPGHVRFLPYETVPITHTEGVPDSEKALMIELCARPEPVCGNEVVICQHWPIMAPKGQYRLALSLFPWEESHVPDSIVATLNANFDAILSPSRCVTHALTISGVNIPVATIGQPVDLEPFAALAATRTPHRPIRRFLHVSSCFERKGIDILLAAWAKAFSSDDAVTLTIKTFPNPHNDVEARVADLRAKYPLLAPIEIINRDAEREEMPDFYRAADVMVLPTRGEGYNLPALEAMIAGLPLIVTGHGGHRDFCGPEQARLIDYRHVRSTSHVAGDHSMWAEPSLDDLVRALREYASSLDIDTIEARRTKALASATAEGDRRGWTRRFHGVVSDLLTDVEFSAPKLGWVSTWQVQCGVAQYSSYLLDRMSVAVRRRSIVLCDDRTPPGDAEIAYEPVWRLTSDKAGEISDAARRHDVEALVIQHQDGLISWEQIGRIGHDPTLSEIVTVTILHNARNLCRVGGQELEMIASGLSNMTRILVHDVEDANFLLSLGLDRNVGLFPHGAFSPQLSPWPRKIDSDDDPIIGCHGFFFRHKGIDKLIRAASTLRREWPGLKLRLVNARFPGNAHDEVIEECRAVAREVGMEDAIEWHLDFLPVERIESLLSECDIIALPYDESDDSASGAVRTALATMVPLVATRVKIFGDLGNAVCRADSNDPQILANTIAPLLRDPAKRREIQAGMHAWLTAHDWQKMATTLENMLRGLVQQKRLGWLKSPSRLT